jgi:hypothetical protein
VFQLVFIFLALGEKRTNARSDFKLLSNVPAAREIFVVMANRRQSHGLTLPQSSTAPDNVVSNILSSLATLDETAQLHWIQETSRQVDHERAYQREETVRTSNGFARHERSDGYSRQEEGLTAPLPAVGYRDRARNGSFNSLLHSAPSPAVPMGRPTKQGFFRRFMGLGPKVPIEDDLLISTQQPKGLGKSPSSVHVSHITNVLTIGTRDETGLIARYTKHPSAANSRRITAQPH